MFHRIDLSFFEIGSENNHWKLEKLDIQCTFETCLNKLAYVNERIFVIGTNGHLMTFEFKDKKIGQIFDWKRDQCGLTALDVLEIDKNRMFCDQYIIFHQKTYRFSGVWVAIGSESGSVSILIINFEFTPNFIPGPETSHTYVEHVSNVTGKVKKLF